MTNIIVDLYYTSKTAEEVRIINNLESSVHVHICLYISASTFSGTHKCFAILIMQAIVVVNKGYICMLHYYIWELDWCSSMAMVVQRISSRGGNGVLEEHVCTMSSEGNAFSASSFCYTWKLRSTNNQYKLANNTWSWEESYNKKCINWEKNKQLCLQTDCHKHWCIIGYCKLKMSYALDL